MGLIGYGIHYKISHKIVEKSDTSKTESDNPSGNSTLILSISGDPNAN